MAAAGLVQAEEIDVAGSPGRDHADGSGRMRKTPAPGRGRRSRPPS